jgi:hypothetical protein
MEVNIALQISRLAASMLIATVSLVAVDSPASAGSRYTCPSGYFCVWTGENYEGTRRQYNNVGEYNQINVDPIRSAFNNRGKRTYLNELSGKSSTYSCFGPYDYDSVLSGWQIHANSAFLSTYTNC